MQGIRTDNSKAEKINYSPFLIADRCNSEIGSLAHSIVSGQPVYLETAILGIENAAATLELLESYLLDSPVSETEDAPISLRQLQQIISSCAGQIRLSVAGIKANGYV